MEHLAKNREHAGGDERPGVGRYVLADAVPVLLRAEERARENNCQPVVNRTLFSPLPALIAPSF